ncbi:aldo/keto reductase [Acetobacterium bakii]|uniref:NADP-dependent oxidoreductase domain-containing protein n=1 Tax=Acetobacterium bakii TaxID=52689 RepID=A0A0L6U2B0_9FIRM|nr:aldo/keto reductase [Acetobacterium bakii]KNZ42659.1 hypothetical protein AKG39_05845 [Acetobacterium bakii]
MNNRLCLGTVQFGLDYGVNNKKGKPSKDHVFEMLDIAVDRGLQYFDTAAAYGNAEELIGEYVASRGIKNKLEIISKLKPNLIDTNSKSPETVVEKEIINSLKKMNLEALNGYLLHTPTDFYNSEIMEGLVRSKEKGLVKNIGVSIYEFSHAMDVVSSDSVDYIQVPYSIFDQRMDRDLFFQKAKGNNVKVFARSAFLQGLLVMDGDSLPHHLEHAKRYLKIYEEILNKYRMTKIEGAIHFSYDNPNIDYVVFGVDNKEQLIKNLDIVDKNEINKDYLNSIKAALSNIEESIIFPSLWAKK